MERLTDRMKLVNLMAIRYAKSNVDELNDALASYAEDDPFKNDGKITVDGIEVDKFSENDFDYLLGFLTAKLYSPSA